MHNFKVQDYKKIIINKKKKKKKKKEEDRFAYTESKSFKGSRVLEKLNPTWHFAKSEDIHILVPASFIVNCN